MAQSIIFISSQAFTIWGHGVALGTSWLSSRPKMSPSVPGRLRAKLEEIVRKTKTARTAWRIFISLSRVEVRWGEVRWVLSERLRLGDTETPPADGDIYRTSRYTWWQSVPSVLCLLIRPDSDSYIRHVCTVLIAPGETSYFPQNW